MLICLKEELASATAAKHLPVFEAVYKSFSAQMDFVMSFSDTVGNEQLIGQETKNMFKFMMIESAARCTYPKYTPRSNPPYKRG
jgi:hypothetical protein